METEFNTAGARRSTRKRRKVSSTDAPEQIVTQEQTVEASTKEVRPTRKRKGKLNSLLNMPLDILFEILGHLKPYDLLRLARTTKDFRRLLMNKSSISVWKASLREVPGLPPCPPEMTEPAWTNLVFSPQCTYCLAITRNIEWRFRARICKSCSKTVLGNLRDRLYASYFLFDGQEEPETLEDRFQRLPLMSLIANRPDKRGVRLYRLSDYHELEHRYKVLLQTDEERAAYIDQRKALVEEICQHASLCEAWMKNQVEDRDTELRQLREERRTAIRKKLEELGWGHELANIKYPDNFATHKLVDRPQRLTERIWINIRNELVEYMKQIRVKRLQREFEALVLKRKGFAVQFLRLYRNRSFNEDDVIPDGVDFCNFEPVQELCRRPVDVEVNLDSFAAILPLLPDLIHGWREKADESLAALLKRSVPPTRKVLSWVDEDNELCSRVEWKPNPYDGMTNAQVLEKLKLATTAFTCNICTIRRRYYDAIFEPWYDSDDSDEVSNSQMFFYPQVISHACLTRDESVVDWIGWEFYETLDPSLSLKGGLSKRCSWSSSRLSLDVQAGNIMAEILQLAELDPATATPHDMDKLDLRFACLRCSKDADEGEPYQDDSYERDMTNMPLMKWRQAVKHYKDSHGGYSIKDLRKYFMKVEGVQLDDDLKAAETDYRNQWDAVWQCMHCRDTPQEKSPSTLRKALEHIRISHSITSPVLNTDYCKHPTHLDLESSGPLFWVDYLAGDFSVAECQPADDPPPFSLF
ncbi:unnamed protein product [Cyclocybe aegerita]|uniref:F-box domain-containing protein n=1 Tax=Cyclocybe aegerita TaxID=1973307 RepID=A0A8S0XM13_CYCAE|nr:unnamed protein product [Cyclocybe aegerita]